MTNKIDDYFSSNRGDKAQLMTHIVAGFPSFEANLECVKVMEASGVAMVEIQIPFSDPMADGPTIMKANQTALDNGATLEKVFVFLKELRAAVSLPLLIMSYYNIPFRMGLEKFFEQSEKVGINGLIFPDIPFDTREQYFERISSFNLHPIMVVSPSVSDVRLAKITTLASGMIYTTLRVGITGAKKSIAPSSIDFIKKLRQSTQVPIAAGFGVSSPEQVKQLKNEVDVVVIGSRIIKFFEEHTAEQAIKEMGCFLKECNNS